MNRRTNVSYGATTHDRWTTTGKVCNYSNKRRSNAKTCKTIKLLEKWTCLSTREQQQANVPPNRQWCHTNRIIEQQTTTNHALNKQHEYIRGKEVLTDVTARERKETTSQSGDRQKCKSSRRAIRAHTTNYGGQTKLLENVLRK